MSFQIQILIMSRVKKNNNTIFSSKISEIPTFWSIFWDFTTKILKSGQTLKKLQLKFWSNLKIQSFALGISRFSHPRRQAHGQDQTQQGRGDVPFFNDVKKTSGDRCFLQ